MALEQAATPPLHFSYLRHTEFFRSKMCARKFAVTHFAAYPNLLSFRMSSGCRFQGSAPRGGIMRVLLSLHSIKDTGQYGPRPTFLRGGER